MHAGSCSSVRGRGRLLSPPTRPHNTSNDKGSGRKREHPEGGSVAPCPRAAEAGRSAVGEGEGRGGRTQFPAAFAAQTRRRPEAGAGPGQRGGAAPPPARGGPSRSPWVTCPPPLRRERVVAAMVAAGATRCRAGAAAPVGPDTRCGSLVELKPWWGGSVWGRFGRAATKTFVLLWRWSWWVVCVRKGGALYEGQ